MNKLTEKLLVIGLSELDQQFSLFSFMFDNHEVNLKKEEEISIKAGDIVSEIYNELIKQYIDPNNVDSQKSLNQLCVRLVFCLYAEDASIFGKKNLFYDYLAHIQVSYWRQALIDLFRVLDTKESDRDPYLAEELKPFPYVNGRMFSDENIEIPNFNDELKDLILVKASEDFDWSEFSPTIFGAAFESTLNPETHSSGGMHYT